MYFSFSLLVACEPPFVVIGDGCYLYSGNLGFTVDNIDAARTLCQDEGADLAIANEEDTNQALVLYLLAANSKSLYKLPPVNDIYRPHAEHGEVNVFTGVCLFTGGLPSEGDLPSHNASER